MAGVAAPRNLHGLINTTLSLVHGTLLYSKPISKKNKMHLWTRDLFAVNVKLLYRIVSYAVANILVTNDIS